MPTLATPARLLATGAALLVLVVGAILYLTPSNEYIFLPDRAHPVDPLVTVQGGRHVRGPGGIYFVDVLVRRASLLERLFPGIRDGATLVPGGALKTPGETDTQRRKADLREMSRSQQIAAAVALRSLGYRVVARPTGALVDDVDPRAPAAGKLLPTDVIVSVDGQPVGLLADLRRLVGAHPAGSTLEVGVRRGPSLRQVSVRTVADARQGGRPVIGVIVEQAADIRLPRAVKINAGDVGGPSAGLAFALDILEELGRDVDHGYRIAATGQIELDGSVAPIGGVLQKTIGVRRSHVDVFLVPAGDNAREAERHAGNVRVVPVRTFQQALRVLATLRPKP